MLLRSKFVDLQGRPPAKWVNNCLEGSPALRSGIHDVFTERVRSPMGVGTSRTLGVQGAGVLGEAYEYERGKH